MSPERIGTAILYAALVVMAAFFVGVVITQFG